MTKRRSGPNLRPRVVDIDVGAAPPPSHAWVKAALAEQGVVLIDIARCVADAAVFAAGEAIVEQGVSGRLEPWEIDALHWLITGIVEQKLLDPAGERKPTIEPWPRRLTPLEVPASDAPVIRSPGERDGRTISGRKLMPAGRHSRGAPV